MRAASTAGARSIRRSTTTTRRRRPGTACWCCSRARWSSRPFEAQAQETDGGSGEGEERRQRESIVRTRFAVSAKENGNGSRTDRLADQPRGSQHPTGGATALARYRAHDGAVVRRLKEAESCAAERHAPEYPRSVPAHRVQHEQRQPRCEGEEAHPTEEARGVAVRESAGERSGDGEGERPGRYEKTSLDRAVAVPLNLERQSDECRHLRGEAEQRCRERQREAANAQQIKGDDRCGAWQLMTHEQPCEHATAGELTDSQQHCRPV